MLPWNGKEISDITFEDKYGMMAALLKSKGCKSVATLWIGVRSTFYLEVRTTVRGCDAPFFISNGPCDRVSQMDQPSNGFPCSPSKQIVEYVLARSYESYLRTD